MLVLLAGCLLAWSGWDILTTLLRVYSVEILLMMDSGLVRNM